MSAQLKTAIDRFCALNGRIQRKHMKSALLSVAWNADGWTFDALEAHYRTLVRYLNLQDQGMVLGKGLRHARHDAGQQLSSTGTATGPKHLTGVARI